MSEFLWYVDAQLLLRELSTFDLRGITAARGALLLLFPRHPLVPFPYYQKLASNCLE